MEMSKEYLAGLFDGEGCIVLNRFRQAKVKKGRIHPTLGFSLIVCISNTHLPTLQEVREMYGGNIQTTKGTNRPCYTLRLLQGKKVAPFLRDLQPHARIKKSQIDLALEYIDLYTGVGNKWTSIYEREELIRHKDAYHKKFKELKRI